MNNKNFVHEPVLLNETLEALDCREGGVYLDGTVGGGGHSSEILKRIGPDGFLYCLDRDSNALKAAEEKLLKAGTNFKLIKSNYRDIELVAIKNNMPLLDGILLDIGVSSPQFDQAERGFSFSKDANLDMRFDQDEDIPNAADLVNSLDKDELTDIFSEYGEEPYSKTIAQAIVNERRKNKIRTTTQLSELIIKSLNGKKFKGNIHPATRVFQALRIRVNDELNGLKAFIPQAMKHLNPGGRLAIISFHSLEDRIVKDEFKYAVKECICPPRQPVCTCNKTVTGSLVSKKPILAKEDEIKNNPRSRSAKLRVIKKA